MPITNAIGEQIIEAVVAGPDGANRLLTITGAADVCIRATRQQRATETWTFLVGPSLTRLQFHRANRHGFGSFPDRKRTNRTAGVHSQCPLRRGRLGR